MKITSHQKLCSVNAMLNGGYDFVVMPTKHYETRAKLQAFLDGYKADDDTDAAVVPEEPPQLPTPNNIEVIPVVGELVKAGGLDPDLCAQFGICDIDNVAADLKKAASDDSVQVICMLFDSGGGEVVGVRELAELIKATTAKKLVLGACFTLCASGAYWLASQCSAFFCNYSSTIGNVGCYVERPDLSEQLKQQGVVINLVQSGAFKTFGHPATVMSETEKRQIQERVDIIGNEFRQAVLANRDIDPQYLQGQCFLGEQAATNHLADANVSDLDTLLTFFAGYAYIYE
jgi:ClpP class serine protease